MSDTPNHIKRRTAAYNYFLELWNVKRLRYDDSIQKTAEKFFYTERTVEDIIRLMRKEG